MNNHLAKIHAFEFHLNSFVEAVYTSVKISTVDVDKWEAFSNVTISIWYSWGVRMPNANSQPFDEENFSVTPPCIVNFHCINVTKLVYKKYDTLMLDAYIFYKDGMFCINFQSGFEKINNEFDAVLQTSHFAVVCEDFTYDVIPIKEKDTNNRQSLD